MFFWRSGAWVVALLGAGAIIAWYFGWRVETLSPPPPSEAQTIEAALSSQTATVLPFTGEVLFWILKYPETPTAEGDLLIGPESSAALPRFDLREVPSNVLSDPGRYLSVSDANGDFVYIAWLGDPRTIRGESSSGGDLEVVYVEAAEGGVSSGKAPFVPDGVLRIFEIRNGQVSRVFLKVRLPDDPYPGRGKRFEVPFS